MRKYDDGTGRFTSIDNYWEKYYSLSPYQYSANNPLIMLDRGGLDIMVLIDREGASEFGHTAVLIGDNSKGWGLYSKNGAVGGGLWGESDYQIGKGKDYFSNLDEFISNTDKKQTRYEEGYLITKDKKDEAMKSDAKAQAESDYSVSCASCRDVVKDALNAAGMFGGFSKYPIKQYEQIKKYIPGKTLDFDKSRKQKEMDATLTPYIDPPKDDED